MNKFLNVDDVVSFKARDLKAIQLEDLDRHQSMRRGKLKVRNIFSTCK